MMKARDLIKETLSRIVLIPQRPHNREEDILAHIEDGYNVCVCDFYVQGAEKSKVKEYGLVGEKMMHIDHHSPLDDMKKHVSSGNLACTYARQNGPLDSSYKIVLNHTDCDSILSSLIMLGILKPERRFEEAVIAADHTGDENKIADLLQSIEHTRDLDFILDNLFNLLEGREIDETAKEMLLQRREMRRSLKEEIDKGNYHKVGSVSYMVDSKRLDPAMFASLLPESKAVFTAKKRDNGRWSIRIRLGKEIDDMSLHDLDLPDFGGRWNAGSTRRHNGTEIEPKRYAEILDSEIKKKVSD